jgi:flagellar hook assembly protein FlgD
MSTSIAFDLPIESKVEIIVYDLMGREIWKTAKTDYTAGTHSLIWNGTNRAGQPVGTGVYLIHLNSRKYSAIQKVLLMK